MLVLSRKLGEAIVIDGGKIVVTVVEIKNEKIKLGIEAPPEISVHRAEIQRRVDNNEPRRSRA